MCVFVQPSPGSEGALLGALKGGLVKLPSASRTASRNAALRKPFPVSLPSALLAGESGTLVQTGRDIAKCGTAGLVSDLGPGSPSAKHREA